MAKTALPVASAAIVANGLQGLYLHGRGIAQKAWRLVVVGCGAGRADPAAGPGGVEGGGPGCGPFWDPDTDWVSDEAGSHHLYWTDPRVIAGSDPVPLGSNNSGRGVGGSMVHYAGYTPRFHPSDFITATLDGVGAEVSPVAPAQS